MQVMPAWRQLEHGDCLSHRTFRLRHTMQLRVLDGDGAAAAAAAPEAKSAVASEKSAAGEGAFGADGPEAPVLVLVLAFFSDISAQATRARFQAESPHWDVSRYGGYNVRPCSLDHLFGSVWVSWLAYLMLAMVLLMDFCEDETCKDAGLKVRSEL